MIPKTEDFVTAEPLRVGAADHELLSREDGVARPLDVVGDSCWAW